MRHPKKKRKHPEPVSRFIGKKPFPESKLTVTETFRHAHGYTVVVCRCDCGSIGDYRTTNVVSGATKSCGCTTRTAGGASGTREYSRWRSMILGFRGEVDPRWKMYQGYVATVGEIPNVRKSIATIDPSKPLGPENYKWVGTGEGRVASPRPGMRILRHGGERMSVNQWAKRTGMSHQTIRRRLECGWTASEALTIPPQPSGFCIREHRRAMRKAKVAREAQ